MSISVYRSSAEYSCYVCATTGLRCDQCKVGFFNLTSADRGGCEPCNCDPSRSLTTICDRDSGECRCKPNFIGRRCEFCPPGSYDGVDLLGGRICSPCKCDDLRGVVPNSRCDATNGQCVCKEYVTGRHCDTCKHGYYKSVYIAQRWTWVCYIHGPGQIG